MTMGTPARDVAPGTSWAFDHRSLAEIGPRAVTITRRLYPGDTVFPCETVDTDDSHHGFYTALAWRPDGQCPSCPHAACPSRDA